MTDGNGGLFVRLGILCKQQKMRDFVVQNDLRGCNGCELILPQTGVNQGGVQKFAFQTEALSFCNFRFRNVDTIRALVLAARDDEPVMDWPVRSSFEEFDDFARCHGAAFVAAVDLHVCLRNFLERIARQAFRLGNEPVCEGDHCHAISVARSGPHVLLHFFRQPFGEILRIQIRGTLKFALLTDFLDLRKCVTNMLFRRAA